MLIVSDCFKRDKMQKIASNLIFLSSSPCMKDLLAVSTFDDVVVFHVSF